jgi:Rrf2 family protein
MLSMRAKYGLRAMTALAREYGTGRPMLIADLARSESIPRKFLEMILLELKKKGLLASKKGKGGGYLLSRSPEIITVGEMIRALDGPLAMLPCVSQTAYRRCDECIDELTCGIRSVMKEVRDATSAILDGTTLNDLIVRANQMLESPQARMYHI